MAGQAPVAEIVNRPSDLSVCRSGGATSAQAPGIGLAFHESARFRAFRRPKLTC